MPSIDFQSGLQGQLLIAQPSANSTFFAQSVVLVCENHASGAWGIMLNRPSTTTTVGDIAKSLNIDYQSQEPVYIGGPVQEDSLYFIHTPDCLASNTYWVTNTLCVTGSETILRELANGRGPSRWRLAIGISSWKGGQLEGEMSGEPPWTPQHRWLTQKCPPNILERPVSKLWQESTAVAISNSVNSYFN